MVDYEGVLFDVLEALKVHFPSIAGGFARGTGGVDRDFIVSELRRSPKVDDPRAPGFYWIKPIFDVDSDADAWHQHEQPAYWDGKLWHIMGVEDEAWQPIWVGEPVVRRPTQPPTRRESRWG